MWRQIVSDPQHTPILLAGAGLIAFFIAMILGEIKKRINDKHPKP